MSDFELAINEFSGSFGVGDYADRPVKVLNAVPGDRWRVRLIHRGRAADIAHGIELLDASSERAEPQCAVQAQCGACPWQMASVESQRFHKRRMLIGQLEHLVSSNLVERVVATVESYGYRTKSHMPVGVQQGELVAGFWAPRSRELVAVTYCAVQDIAIERIRAAVLHSLNMAGVTAWNAQTGEGELRSILIRTVNGRKKSVQVGLVLVVADESYRDWQELVDPWLETFGVTSVWINLHDEPTNAMLGDVTKHLAGAEWLEQSYGAYTLYRGATAFSQSSESGERLLAEVVSQLVPAHCETLLDLYAGAGLFTAVLADRMHKAILVERVPSGMSAAQKTFASADHVDTRVGAVEEVLPELIGEGFMPDLVVVDPPRSGLAASVIQALGALTPKDVIYVSCQPRTLARDLYQLTESQFRVKRVVPVDMFPHTPHLEVVVHLESMTR